jgi:hypothetical protein
MKKLIYLLISIIFLVISLFYYSHYNSKGSLRSIRNDISSLIAKAEKDPYTKELSSVEQVEYSLTQNKLVSKDIINWYKNDFKASWEKSILDTNTVKMYNSQNETFFEPLIVSTQPTATNQLYSVIIIYLLFSIFLALALFSNILRDIVNDPVLKQQVQSANCFPPFSLSRTQLAIWITIIASFYVHGVLWNHCSFIGPINTTALILMGISAGTFATGAIIDTIEIQQGVPRNQNQLSSGNFFVDILSDSQGISIQRFQNLIWTIVAIIIYFYSYNNNVSNDCLPTLEPTLLALTGISSATYLTLKTRENIFLYVRIHLVVMDLTKKSEIDTNGWSHIEVKLKDGTGKEILAVSDAGSKYDFIVSNLTPGIYSINVSAKSKISGADTDFSGDNTGVINTTTSQPISIPIK